MNVVILSAVALLSLTGTAAGQDDHLSLNPCQGITEEEIVSTFNAHGVRYGGLNGPLLTAYGASPFSSTTAAFGPGYPGICTGYLAVGLASNPKGIEAFHYNVYRDPSGQIVLRYVRDLG